MLVIFLSILELWFEERLYETLSSFPSLHMLYRL